MSLQAILLKRPNLVHQIQKRWNWQTFLSKRYDRTTNTYRYEDWDKLVSSMREPDNSQNQTLAQIYYSETEHVKPTERKRRINARKDYSRKIKRIEDLTKYIKFMKMNKQDWKQLK